MLPQATTSYLYDNIIPVQILVDASIKQRNRVVYARTLKLYKGINNEVKFEIKNQDQQVVNVTDYGFTLSLVDDDKKSVIIAKDAFVANANAGIISVTFTESEIQGLQNQWFSYNLLGTDPNGATVPLYIDDNYGARGQAQVLSGHFPEYKDSTVIIPPAQPANATVTTSSISSQNTCHTTQLFFDTFTGNITTQATMDPIPMIANLTANWFDTGTITFAAQTASTIQTFEGLYSAVRFAITPTTGTVTKILYRS